MDKYDIILQAGQSNADGYGHGPVEHPYAPDERILYLTAGNPKAGEYYPKGELEISVAAERPIADKPGDLLGDFSLEFARKYVEDGRLAPDRKLLIVRTAVGGTGFLKEYWRVGDPLHQRMLRMTDYAMGLNGDNRLVGFLWHQGEHEAAFLNDPQRYHDEFTAVVKSVLERYGDMPFVCGGFCSQWAQENQPACDNVQGVIRAVAEKVGGAYVETADLRSNDRRTGDGDTIHFCREDLQELGRRYFRAFIRQTK
jgi:hypothetical protein